MDDAEPTWANTKSIGWWIVRDGRHIRLYQLWWPIDKYRHPIKDHVAGARRSFLNELSREAAWRVKHIASRFGLTGGGEPTPESRQLALTILVERFDWSTAVSLLDAFHSDFISPIRLKDGERRWIAKEDLTYWWALKEDQVAGQDTPPELAGAIASGFAL